MSAAERNRRYRERHPDRLKAYYRKRKARCYECFVWQRIKQRCLNPNRSGWKNYGGRGITVWSGWIHDFAAFYAHIGPRPSPKHSIDRIDNNRGYEPGNVRWATASEQVRNSRVSKIGLDEIPLMRYWYECGYSQEEIAQAWNVSSSAISRTLSSQGGV